MSHQQDVDYIIVGGGAAGCVLAARLAAESDASVALIEWGDRDRAKAIHVPGVFPRLFTSRHAQQVYTEPNDRLNGREIKIQQGHVLGGGSSIGAMIYIRGQREDYDGWARDHGCDGWSFDDVLPVFRRHERNMRLSNAYHGTEGPMIVADPGAPHEVSQRAIDAIISTGVPATDDFNGATQEGAGWYQLTAHAGQRQSAAYCFLRPVMDRENLQVMTGMTAERIRFEGRRASALELRDASGDEHVLRARREIILTAGTFQSAKILMLSGVGPAGDLDRLGIDVVHDAPEVGQNYHDHLSTPATFCLNGIDGLYGQDRGRHVLRHLYQFIRYRKGLLTSGHIDAGACVDTQGTGRPDIQYNIAPFALAGAGQPRLEAHAMMMNTIAAQPKSRGRVGLRSKNPSDTPLVIANALDHPDDFEALRRGVRLAQSFYAQSPLKEVLGDRIWPGPDVSMAQGSDAFDDAIRSQIQSMAHPAGTCRMGSDAGAVVDLALRVNGVEGLRVADCSVMPVLPSGNTRAPTMMIADRAATAVLNA